MNPALITNIDTGDLLRQVEQRERREGDTESADEEGFCATGPADEQHLERFPLTARRGQSPDS